MQNVQETSIRCSGLVPRGCVSAYLQVASAPAQLPAPRQLAPKPVAAVGEADGGAEAVAPAGDAPSAQGAGGGSKEEEEEEEEGLSIDSGSGSDSDDDEAAEVATATIFPFIRQDRWAMVAGDEGGRQLTQAPPPDYRRGRPVARGAISKNLPCHGLTDSFFRSVGNGAHFSECTPFFGEQD